MEYQLKIIASLILAVFFIFFFGRNFVLKLQLKKSIIGHDPFIFITILTFTFIVTVFLLSIWNRNSVFIFFSISPLNHDTVKIIAMILMVFATIICIISSLTLRNSWRVGIPSGEKTKLIRHGIYSRCRNPYFLAYYTFFLSMFLFSANSLIGFIMVVGIIPLHRLVKKEEKYLEEIHGNYYLGYKNNVKRYWLF